MSKKHKKEMNENIMEETKVDLEQENLQLKEKNASLEQEIVALKTKLENTEAQVASLNKTIVENNNAFISKSKELSAKASQQLKELEAKNHEILQQEKKNIKLYGNQSFFEKALPILSNFDIAIEAGMNNENSVVQRFSLGFEMLKRQLENVFEASGVKVIDINVGDEYDAHLASVTLEDENAPKNIVTEVLSYGYELNGRVIIPAKVKIGSKEE